MATPALRQMSEQNIGSTFNGLFMTLAIMAHYDADQSHPYFPIVVFR